MSRTPYRIIFHGRHCGYLTISTLVLLLFIVYQQAPGQWHLRQADTLLLKQHIAALSADSMRGRRAGTSDEQKAARYIESYYRDLRLLPAGESGSYFQPVPFPRGRIFSPSNIIVQNDTLSYPIDFSIYQVPAGPRVFDKGLVLAGYGIHAPEQQVDSYGGIDVRNKIVVALNSRLWNRKRLPKNFQADHESQARWAREQGAAGLILLDDSPTRDSRRKKTDRKAIAELFNPIDTVGFLWIEIADGNDFARKLFHIAALSTIGPIDHSSSMAGLLSNIDCESMTSSNVIGRINGTDRKEEYVIITAHYDHLGVGQKVAGDSIYNGALDNASGVAVLLEIARLFCSSSEKPRRSIMFLATGAEEPGFFGSKHFVAHPTVPLKAIVANINIDVAGFGYGSNECWMTLLGNEYNDMGTKFEKAANDLGVHIMPNVLPSYYKRGEGYIFAQAGIPALSPASGMPLKVLDDGMNYFLKFYHQREDELGKTPINFQVIGLQTQVIDRAVLDMANDESVPKWTSDLDSDDIMTMRDTLGKIRILFAKFLF